MEIKFDHVTFAFDKTNYVKKTVLEDISFQLEENKIHAFVGKSGSGKSTLLELIDGLLLPTSGTIQIGSTILTPEKNRRDLEEVRKKVGLLFQFSDEQFFHLTVLEELNFRLQLYQYHLEEANKRILDALKIVGLKEPILTKNPFLLSSGEKRKVALASVLIYNPKIILLDEPTTGLDASSKKQLLTLLRILKNRYHKTIVVVSHDTDFIHQIADKVYLLADQKLIAEGTKYEIFTREDLKKYGLKPPKVIEFSKKVLDKKKIKLGYRDDINDLIKDIYRYVS